MPPACGHARQTGGHAGEREGLPGVLQVCVCVCVCVAVTVCVSVFVSEELKYRWAE